MQKSTLRYLLYATGIAFAGAFAPVGIGAVAAPSSERQQVEAPRLAASDSLPANPVFTASPNVFKEPYVRLRITIPTTNRKGLPVSPITKVTLYRAGAVYKTFVPEEGQETIIYDDTVPTNHKSYQYGVVATNKFGNSTRVNKTVYVGQQKPKKPDNVVIVADSANHRKASVSWTAPAKDAGNLDLDPSTLTYRVVLSDHNNKDIELARGLTECKYEINYTGEGYGLFSVKVYASNVGGESAVSLSGNAYKTFLGDPIVSDFAESFPKGKNINPVKRGAISSISPSWFVCDDSTFAGVESSDNDNGYLGAQGYEGCIGAVITNYIDLTKFAHPWASIQFYRHDPAINNSIRIGLLEGTIFHSLKTVDLAQLPYAGWNQVALDLAPFKTLYSLPQLCILVDFHEENASMFEIDNIRVGNASVPDLGVGCIGQTDFITLGHNDSISAVVSNFCAAESKPYKLELLRNDVVVNTLDMPAIPGLGSVKAFIPENVPTSTSDSVFTYMVRVKMDGDSNSENNSTLSFSAGAAPSVLPVVGGLSSTIQGGEVQLTWEAPDMNRMPMESVTETFESYESFGGNFGPWINIDGDGRNVGGFNINNDQLKVTGPQGFFVMDTEQYPKPASTTLTARPGSGCKFATSLYTNDSKPVDDWLISPELNGSSQLIEMYMLGYFNLMTYWEVLYSTTGRDTTDFKLLKAGKYDRQWKKFNYILPEGAKYFAVHAMHTGPGSSGPASPLFCFDDVKYVPAGKGRGNLVGYRVYNGDRLLTPQPVSAISFNAGPLQATTIYKVTAVYDRGESMPMAIDVKDGVEGIDAAAAIRIETVAGGVLVTAPSAANVAVYTIQGVRVVSRTVDEGSARIPLAPGCYIVTAGGKTAKVIVRGL